MQVPTEEFMSLYLGTGHDVVICAVDKQQQSQ